MPSETEMLRRFNDLENYPMHLNGCPWVECRPRESCTCPHVLARPDADRFLAPASNDKETKG